MAQNEDELEEGCLIDLDDGSTGSVNSFNFLDDFRRPCRVLNIDFSSYEQLFFKNDGTTYFLAMGSKWEPYKVTETFNGDMFGYSCSCHPAYSFLINDKLIEDTKGLADALQLELTSNSEVLPIKVPLKNVTLMRIAWELRNMSIHSEEDISKSAFFYYDGSAAISGQLGTLLANEATMLDETLQFFPSYFDNRYELLWARELNKLKEMSYADHYNKIIKRTIQVSSQFPLNMFQNYLIPENFNHSELSSSMVCIRQTASSNLQTHPYKATLAEVSFEEE